MPHENLTMQISKFSVSHELPILERMCEQIRKHGDEAEIRVVYQEKSGIKGYAVFRNPSSIKYDEYAGKGKFGVEDFV